MGALLLTLNSSPTTALRPIPGFDLPHRALNLAAPPPLARPSRPAVTRGIAAPPWRAVVGTVRTSALAQKRWCQSAEQDPLTQHGEARPSIHLSFQEFDLGV